MGDLNHKLSIKVQLVGEGIGEIFRWVIRVIDIPLEPILEENIVHLYI